MSSDAIQYETPSGFTPPSTIDPHRAADYWKLGGRNCFRFSWGDLGDGGSIPGPVGDRGRKRFLVPFLRLTDGMLIPYLLQRAKGLTYCYKATASLVAVSGRLRNQ